MQASCARFSLVALLALTTMYAIGEGKRAGFEACSPKPRRGELFGHRPATIFHWPATAPAAGAVPREIRNSRGGLQI